MKSGSVVRAVLIAAAALAMAAGGASAQVRVDTLPPKDTTAVPARDTSTVVPTGALPDTLRALQPGELTADTIPADSLEDGERAAPPDPEADAIIQELRGLEGYVPTEYLGQRAVYRTDEGELRLIGDAQVEREGSRLNADSIIYRDYADLVEAYGSPRVQGEAQELTGEVLYYDLVTRRASAYGARTEVQQSATWIVTGDVTVESGEDTRIYATEGHFTTCDLAIPHYHFEADQIKIVRDKYLVGRPARLYFGRVPVMVLPFFVQSLEQGRRSGFIVPRFSFTDIVRNSGHTREISDLGWYWAVNEYLGAQLTGRWRSGAYSALTGNVDFRWRKQFLNGGLSFTRYWQQSGRRDFSLDGNASWRPDERTSLSGNGRFTTSSEFIRESTIDPLEATQDLNSSLSFSRRFDWGTMAIGATGRQSMADGGLAYTLPSFSVQPNPITFLRSSSPALARWYNDATLTWNFKARRSGRENVADIARDSQDEQETDLNGGVSLSFGRLSLSTSGTLNQTELEEISGVVVGRDQAVPCGAPLPGVPLQGRCLLLDGVNRDEGAWNASIGYQQELIGQTTITPSLGFSQQVLRDELTDDRYVTAPMRMNFGASLQTAIFGRYGAVGPFSAIRHRISPGLSFTYSPAVEQNQLQEDIFGAVESRTQNIVTLGFNQTWEAKLRRPQRDPEADSVAALMDTAAIADSRTARAIREPVPQEEEKVTLLSINTSSLTYDFTRARETGNGFTNTTINNNIKSDYLGGMSVQLSHDLFDQSGINPSDAAQRGQLGRFAPRLSNLSTGFSLGPGSVIFRWLSRLGGGENAATDGTIPGEEGPAPVEVATGSTATGNPQALGSGQWRTNVDYSFTRPRRVWDPDGLRDDRAVQTVNLSTSLPLTPNWSADWRTSYSITDTEFSGHSLNFSRNLHRWQANFSFFQTATGNTGFQFYVELIDNTDLQFEYRERNLGIDR